MENNILISIIAVLIIGYVALSVHSCLNKMFLEKYKKLTDDLTRVNESLLQMNKENIKDYNELANINNTLITIVNRLEKLTNSEQ